MLRLKYSYIIGTTLLGLAGVLLVQQYFAGNKTSNRYSNTEETENPVMPANDSKGKNQMRVHGSVAGSDLTAIFNRWKLLSQDGSIGDELFEKQRSIAQAAVANLGPSDELLEFLDFLNQQRAHVIRDWVIKIGAAEMFIGNNGNFAREWVVTIKDRQLREAFCELAGQTIADSEVKEYLHSFGSDSHGQSSVLMSYCRALAKTNPEEAVKAFMEYRPSGVDMSGLSQVMASMPGTTNFANLAGKLPGDSKTLAKNARTSLLAKWAETNPQEAAQYVINNTSVAFPSQMGNVVGVWAKTEPDAAFAWVAALPPGEYRDEGMLSVIRHYRFDKPATAWQHVSQIDDKNKRLNIATSVLNEWIKTDRDSALEAWLTLYPRN
jgi:hypothetical protein